jgi:hypothetical protein
MLDRPTDDDKKLEACSRPLVMVAASSRDFLPGLHSCLEFLQETFTILCSFFESSRYYQALSIER